MSNIAVTFDKKVFVLVLETRNSNHEETLALLVQRLDVIVLATKCVVK